jgi:hypothetical protein
MVVLAVALMGCNGGKDKVEINGGLVSLAGVDGAALAGLIFDFPDATIFGFPGESATLEIGNNAATFTLTLSGGRVINGTINDGAVAGMSCRLTQNPQEVVPGQQQFDVAYDECEGAVDSAGEIEFGGSGPGTVVLSFGNTGSAPVASAPETVTLNLSDDGQVTINNNATPI